ncbi:hypothetical protein BV20DRAFT_721329 [Pilatotrama ljubarskyi]|nr:hypothetical protein BV20DRAFT_721329 [Pilatotrama ljubarskyi]
MLRALAARPQRPLVMIARGIRSSLRTEQCNGETIEHQGLVNWKISLVTANDTSTSTPTRWFFDSASCVRTNSRSIQRPAAAGGSRFERVAIAPACDNVVEFALRCVPLPGSDARAGRSPASRPSKPRGNRPQRVGQGYVWPHTHPVFRYTMAVTTVRAVETMVMTAVAHRRDVTI